MQITLEIPDDLSEALTYIPTSPERSILRPGQPTPITPQQKLQEFIEDILIETAKNNKIGRFQPEEPLEIPNALILKPELTPEAIAAGVSAWEELREGPPEVAIQALFDMLKGGNNVVRPT